MSKYVTSWNISILSNGVYQLVINTSDKWVPYHAYNDTKFEIGADGDTETLEIPEFLPKIVGLRWVRYSLQEKDQIMLLWIPGEWFMTKKLVELEGL